MERLRCERWGGKESGGGVGLSWGEGCGGDERRGRGCRGV